MLASCNGVPPALNALVCILQNRTHGLKGSEEDSPEATDLSEKATSSEDWQQLQSLASTFSGVTLFCLDFCSNTRDMLCMCWYITHRVGAACCSVSIPMRRIRCHSASPFPDEPAAHVQMSGSGAPKSVTGRAT